VSTAPDGQATDASLDPLLNRLERRLEGDTRTEILERARRGTSPRGALDRLRAGMARHRFETAERTVELAGEVERLDLRTQEEGFHVLQAWAFREQRFSEDNIAVLMVDFARRQSIDVTRTTLSILLDHYFLHLLALLTMRVWDAPDPDAALRRVGRLLGLLQGEAGSGHQFVADAETLLVLAVSYFHPEEAAYDRLIERVETLGPEHRTAFALSSAAALGSHLRWGLGVMYRWDVQRMREDNVGDYPWLLFSVDTLLEAFASGDLDEGGRTRVVHGLLNGLSADPWAFVGEPPPALEPVAEAHAACRARILEQREALLEVVRANRPGRDEYAPTAFLFNFPNNTLVAGVTVALLEGRPQRLPMNALFQTGGGEEGDGARRELALRYMEYAGSSQERLDAHGARLIMYAPRVAARCLNLTLGALKKAG